MCNLANTSSAGSWRSLAQQRVRFSAVMVKKAKQDRTKPVRGIWLLGVGMPRQSIDLGFQALPKGRTLDLF